MFTKMKKILFILCLLFMYNWVNATVCEFVWYKIHNDNVYSETYCDDSILDLIPFADNESFKVGENNNKKWSDYNYNYIENYVEWLVSNRNFINLDWYFYTDRKNIFIKTQGLYLFISKYRFDAEIFTIYESENSWRYVLKVDWNVLNINISGDYVSYNWGIHNITNIKNINTLKQINQFILTDWEYFYSSNLVNKSKVGMNFGFELLTAEFFATNNKQISKINKTWNKLLSFVYSVKQIDTIKLTYNQLKLKKNPYNYEKESQEYWEFIIKKELLLYYLWELLNKQ